jgi:hypothetical protein
MYLWQSFLRSKTKHRFISNKTPYRLYGEKFLRSKIKNSESVANKICEAEKKLLVVIKIIT